MSEVRELIRELKKDKLVKSLHEQFAVNPGWRLDLETYEKEIVLIHSSRKIKSLDLRKSKQTDSVIDANLHEQSSRSRLVEIILTCRKVHNEITRQLDVAREVLMLKHKSSFGSLRSREDRNKAIDYGVFRAITTELLRIEQLENDVQQIVEDIDKSGFTLKRHVEVLNLTLGSGAKEYTL